MAPRNSYYYPDGRPKQFTLAGGSAKPVPHKKALEATNMASVFMPKQQGFAPKTSHAAAAAVVENDAPTPASIPDSQASMWRGLFTSPSAESGTPDTQVQSKEEYEQESKERRRQWVAEAAKRRERWMSVSNSGDEDMERALAAQLEAEQLQTHTQIERNEENHRRSSDREKRQRPPTAPMTDGDTSAVSSPLFTGNSEGNSPEEGEIAEGVNSTSQTFGRMGPPSRVVVPAFGAPQRTSPQAKAQAPVEADKAKAATAIVSPARKQLRKQPSIQSISSDDTESLIEPDEGVPAFAQSSPRLNYRPKHVEQVSRDRAAQPDAVELPYISSDVAPTPRTETETQWNQARVDKINAMQEKADPDFDTDEAVEYDDNWEGVAGPSHRTRARSKHENDVDFPIPESDVDTGADVPILESDIDPGARPISAAKRKAKASSPYVPSAKKKKRSEGLRPGDSGWRFEKLSLKGKQQRQHLIDEMQSEWNATVETVVPDDIRPRWTDGAAIGTAKMPNDWSTELLEALRNFSLQTSGNPAFATQVLREAVKQQVARHGGGPALYKADVKVAINMVNKRQAVPGAAPLSPDLNTRTREISLDDRPAAFNMLNRSVSKHNAAANSDRARANSNGSPVTKVRRSPSGDEADVEMALDTERGASLAEVLQRENRSDQTLTTDADQVQIADAPGLQTGKRKREMQMKLAILDYEEARARKKLVQAELHQISARKKLLSLGIDPDDVL